MIVHSYGIIPLRKELSGEWEVLLIQHRKGLYWSFPKGHAEEGEEPLQTASRELYEETGLLVKTLLSEEVFTENYQFISNDRLISKYVAYYLALVEGTLSMQAEEISDAKWVLFSEVPSFISFPESQTVCSKAYSSLHM
ncbi:MAG: bis(5'-nucleosyl)-tetraphosphatase [Parachlamydiaceae bacterium]